MRIRAGQQLATTGRLVVKCQYDMGMFQVKLLYSEYADVDKSFLLLLQKRYVDWRT